MHLIGVLILRVLCRSNSPAGRSSMQKPRRTQLSAETLSQAFGGHETVPVPDDPDEDDIDKKDN